MNDMDLESAWAIFLRAKDVIIAFAAGTTIVNQLADLWDRVRKPQTVALAAQLTGDGVTGGAALEVRNPGCP